MYEVVEETELRLLAVHNLLYPQSHIIAIFLSPVRKTAGIGYY